VSLPLGPGLRDRVARFRPDVIHAQHPFLLGSSALRLGALHGVPVVFTHHTLYEQYTHYVPFDSEALQAFVIELATRFANCCQGVIAPSESLARLLRERGVTTPVKVVPTGVDTARFGAASRATWRRRLDLPEDAVVLGHVGRLAVEKNLPFLAEALARCLAREKRAHVLLVGDGPARSEVAAVFARHHVAARVHLAGQLTGRALRDAYAAMDLFAFSSHSETQGMVLTEAMATGCPVLALDASGVRDVVRSGENGRLLPADATEDAMARALVHAVRQTALRRRWRAGARRTVRAWDRRVCAREALDFYQQVRAAHPVRARSNLDEFEAWWVALRDRVVLEGRLVSDKIAAATHAIVGSTTSAEPVPASA
jgi:glycosyltransferase involved in cell wall biosynthesis